MPFDAAAVRRELAELEERLEALEAEGGDEDEILDLVCEVHELRDELRNHETYPAFWAEPPAPAAPASAELCRKGCWRVPGLLGAAECAGLRGALQQETRVGGGRGATLSDDPDFAAELWRRVRAVVPSDLEATVAPAAEAALRMECWPEFQWQADWQPAGVDPRMEYEQVPGAGERAGARLDTQEADDRDEGWRPLVSLLVALGGDADTQAAADAQAAAGGRSCPSWCLGEAQEEAEAAVFVDFTGGQLATVGAGAPAAEAAAARLGFDLVVPGLLSGGGGPPGSRTARLQAGDAALFVRGDERLTYEMRPARQASETVLRAKVLYALPEMPASRASVG